MYGSCRKNHSSVVHWNRHQNATSEPVVGVNAAATDAIPAAVDIGFTQPSDKSPSKPDIESHHLIDSGILTLEDLDVGKVALSSAAYTNVHIAGTGISMVAPAE